MSNYPPGVTGREWEIAGYPDCMRQGCGHSDADHEEPIGGGYVLDPILGDGKCRKEDCECEGYTPYPVDEDYP